MISFQEFLVENLHQRARQLLDNWSDDDIRTRQMGELFSSPRKALKETGLYAYGKGTYKIALTKTRQPMRPSQSHVYVVFRGITQPEKEFINFVKKSKSEGHPWAKHLPDIKGGIIYQTNLQSGLSPRMINYHGVLKIKKYKKLSDKENITVSHEGNGNFKEMASSTSLPDSQKETFFQAFRALHQHMLSKGLIPDVDFIYDTDNSGNFLKDKNGTIIISDPVV